MFDQAFHGNGRRPAAAHADGERLFDRLSRRAFGTLVGFAAGLMPTPAMAQKDGQCPVSWCFGLPQCPSYCCSSGDGTCDLASGCPGKPGMCPGTSGNCWVGIDSGGVKFRCCDCVAFGSYTCFCRGIVVE
jgi:hypothetical protein